MSWGSWNKAQHPPYTNYRHYFKEVIDYIFYTPESMKVEMILKLPSGGIETHFWQDSLTTLWNKHPPKKRRSEEQDNMH